MDAIVLVGHGGLPEAMKSSVEMIVGEREDICTVCLSPDDGKEELDRKLAAHADALKDCASIRVIADLQGGSPCNAALERFLDDDRVSITSGMNLAMVISAALEGTDTAALVAEGRAAVRDIKALARGEEEPEVRPARAAAPAPRSDEPQQIVGVRVDARGIHGQVATAWAPHLNVTRFVVVDELAVRDDTQKMALKIAKPASAKLSILTPRKAVERLSDERSYPGERVFVVMTRVKTLAELDALGYGFACVNMGNVPNRPGTTSYDKTVHLTDEEADIVRALAAKGTRFTSRQVPADPENDFTESLTR